MKEIHFGIDAKDLIIEGINELNKAVSATMGPMGKTVIIPNKNKYGEYIVTKDGISVAEQIRFKNPLKNIGAELIKQAAKKTVEDAGDGTTTSTVLATAFVNNLKDFNTVDINKAFDEIIPKVIEQLKLNSRQLKHEDIKYVASISANNDLQIGDIIQQAYNHSDIVKIEESTNITDVLETLPGMLIPVSYFSKHFITNQSKGVCEFENVNTLIIDGKLEKLENFRACLEVTQDLSKSLLIIAEDIHEQALRKLESLVLTNGFKICVIKAPGFSKHRKELLDDLCDFTNSTLIKDLSKSYDTTVLGKLQSCKISKNNSVLVKDESIDISKKIESLNSFYTNIDLEEYDKDLLKQRIEYLKGKISIIKVGGKSELEVKERYDRYDDAVKAVACALEEGIVEGAGVALSKIENKFRQMYGSKGVYDEILKSLNAPYDKITETTIVIKFYSESMSMFNQNIIDPLKVTRCALENAVSVAKIILSTEAVVLNQEEWMK
jgi:chaperonin GroEL